ncbi:hypothetical protein BH11PSE14_BH11PSE14_09000 [soil metagenome]
MPRLRVIVILCLVLLASGSAGARQVDGQEHLGTVRQALVGGTPVDEATQESYGLLSLNGNCSASLLRNEWAITAAHCVDNADDRAPNGFRTNADDSADLHAEWGGGQDRRSLRIISFRPVDIALIRLDRPFTVDGSTRKYQRALYRGPWVPLRLHVFGRGIYQFAKGAGEDATPAMSDDQYRVGEFFSDDQDATSYWFPRTPTQALAGGDSGGPSFTNLHRGGGELVGVHSQSLAECAEGKACGLWTRAEPKPAGYSTWRWVANTTRIGDAPVSLVADEIDRYLGAFVPEPSQFIGTFSSSTGVLQPMWVYAIAADGRLVWYRKDGGAAPWQGPITVSGGWTAYREVVAAGGNSLFALSNDGHLFWLRHDGFNDGSREWSGPVELSGGWDVQRIFAGGDGIVYAIKSDGALLWCRDANYVADGGELALDNCRVVGSGWGDFKDVFSEGKGTIYAIKADGTLLLYHHLGYANGDWTWTGPATIGSDWQQFQQVVATGDGNLLAIRPDGRMLLYRYRPPRAPAPGYKALGRVGSMTWQGPVEIGSGWTGFRKVFALLPTDAGGPR